MARQEGDIKLSGTLDDITFYKRNGGYFARMKSSLTRQRFMKDKCFEGSRKSSDRMGKASPFASKLYHLLPKEAKKFGVFQTIVGQVTTRIKKGWQDDEIREWFMKTWMKIEAPVKPSAKKNKVKRKAAATVHKSCYPVCKKIVVREGLFPKNIIRASTEILSQREVAVYKRE